MQCVKIWALLNKRFRRAGRFKQNLCSTGRKTRGSNGSDAVIVRGSFGLIGKPFLAGAPLDEILPENNAMKRREASKVKPASAVEYDTPAQTANSLAFNA